MEGPSAEVAVSSEQHPEQYLASNDVAPAAATTAIATSTAETEVEVDAAPAEELTAEAAMKHVLELFGPYFKVPSAAEIVNPVLVDTTGVLLTHFGPHVQLEDISLADRRTAEQEFFEQMKINITQSDYLKAVGLFGEHGTKIFIDSFPEMSTTLQAALPSVPDTEDYDELWLVDMPKIDPNRQTLHADPQPFFPAKDVYVESNPRMLYTPSNVMRWAFHEESKTYLSNCRMVRWSDGTVTLHIGTDVFTLNDSRDTTYLDLLASPSNVRKGNVAFPSLVNTLNPDRHFVIESNEAASIERAIVAEGEEHRSGKQMLPFITAPLPNVNWAKPTEKGSVYEEHVAHAYRWREAEIKRRKREGRPMTMAEQLEMENELMRTLHTASAEQLREGQEHLRQQRAERENQARERQKRRRGGLREVTLQGGNEDVDRDEIDDDDDHYLEEIRKRHRGEDSAAANGGDWRGADDDDEGDSDLVTAVTEAVEKLLAKLPPSSESHGSVEGTLNLIQSGSMPLSFVKTEIPQMLREVRQELPDTDTADLEKAYAECFGDSN